MRGQGELMCRRHFFILLLKKLQGEMLATIRFVNYNDNIPPNRLCHLTIQQGKIGKWIH